MRNAMLTLKTTLKTATSGTLGSVLKPALFAVLMWAASAAGAVPIPGTPVPITLQTFVVMLAALMLPWKQAGRPERRLPDRLPAGGRRHFAAQGRGPHRFAEARCADRRTLSVRLHRRLHCA